MPAMHIKKSIHIDAEPEEVFKTVADFNTWATWSPWLIMEPEASVTVSDDAKFYEWEGKRVGSGNMKITASKNNKSVDYDLMFLKPWKSTSKVRFELHPETNGTRTEWYMEGSLPFFMFWMKKMMEAYVGNDYDRGLMLLKDYVEDGTIHSSLDIRGQGNFEGCSYVGLNRQCTLGNIGEGMREDFDKLSNYFSEKKELVADNPFSIYHKWDIVKNTASYTAAFPVKGVPQNLPAGFISGVIPAMPVYTLRHTGPHHHLGNAWSTMYNLQRSKVFRYNKKFDPFETYLNMPGEVTDNELISEIKFPVK